MKKKGNLLDIPLIAILIFVAFVVAIISFMIMSKINTGLIETNKFSNESLDIIQHQVDVFPSIWDKGLLFILVGLCIYTWISAFFVRSHPVFFIIGFFLIVIYVIVFGVMSNTYQDLNANAEINPYSSQFTAMSFIMNKFPFIMLIFSSITAIIMFSKGGEPVF